VKQPYAGIYIWRDPHGRYYLVDHTGTRATRPTDRPADRPADRPTGLENLPVDGTTGDHDLEFTQSPFRIVVDYEHSLAG
jgi:hypothetical protein